SYIPVNHEGNRQSSEEEAQVVQKIVSELMQMNFKCEDASLRTLSKDDILIVAPYNLQARLLQKVLGSEFRIASVDKFQGQEAPVVILSLGTSSVDEAPRGIDFIFDRHRLNVALSRAQSLAIVVGTPSLAHCYPKGPEQMALVNFYCRIILNGEVLKSREPKAA
ncbi:MAG: C-terminal helicase domain-containing protein, partial [Proteobacteria bacterium]|nr:C-terminal helicase domain-containing protein [Pseudomonadota bacterium]